ncbi:SRPBCC family protein [Goodfellowiella coeruleoviolacea]|uniref:Polyketide cyclase / dehydrase and lipid transport n=1 Tax=Goodfellowiella coeruleoviolacea TaxID=334858 RepID=A0AAE3G9N5_9PSEU|nr:SRPBCC family protein [Goodfellowiella coeruleoviolacea]MCP2163449.1 Polyketide cyclase / dehydrase and lipid transport [Goodfellowiella coeruleoviolacea]
MRFADGPTTECAVRVAAGVARVWELVTDIELPARFSPELQRVRWLDGADRPVLGARFEGHNHHAVLGDWRTVSHVVELDAPRAFGWVVVDPDNRFGEPLPDPEASIARWRFDLQPCDDGTTLLRHTVRIGPARSGLTLAIERRPADEEQLVATRLDSLRAGMRETLRGIKALAEQAG